MRILCVCDQGNNRSVTIASRIKYQGHDVLSAGLSTNSPDTLELLYEWAEKIITTDSTQEIPAAYATKVTLWDVGPDTYPRPFNSQLLAKVRDLQATREF